MCGSIRPCIFFQRPHAIPDLRGLDGLEGGFRRPSKRTRTALACPPRPSAWAIFIAAGPRLWKAPVLSPTTGMVRRKWWTPRAELYLAVPPVGHDVTGAGDIVAHDFRGVGSQETGPPACFTCAAHCQGSSTIRQRCSGAMRSASCTASDTESTNTARPWRSRASRATSPLGKGRQLPVQLPFDGVKKRR